MCCDIPVNVIHRACWFNAGPASQKIGSMYRAFSDYMFIIEAHVVIAGKTAIIVNPCPAELLQLYFSSFEAGTQFPASNDEKYYNLWKKYMSKIKLLDQLSIY